MMPNRKSAITKAKIASSAKPTKKLSLETMEHIAPF